MLRLVALVAAALAAGVCPPNPVCSANASVECTSSLAGLCDGVEPLCVIASDSCASSDCTGGETANDPCECDCACEYSVDAVEYVGECVERVCDATQVSATLETSYECTPTGTFLTATVNVSNALGSVCNESDYVDIRITDTSLLYTVTTNSPNCTTFVEMGLVRCALPEPGNESSVSMLFQLGYRTNATLVVELLDDPTPLATNYSEFECDPVCDLALFDVNGSSSTVCVDDTDTMNVSHTIVCSNTNEQPCRVNGYVYTLIGNVATDVVVNSSACGVSLPFVVCTIDPSQELTVVGIEYVLPSAPSIAKFVGKGFFPFAPGPIDMGSESTGCYPRCNVSLFNVSQSLEYVCDGDNVTANVTVSCTNENPLQCRTDTLLFAGLFNVPDALDMTWTGDACTESTYPNQRIVECPIDGSQSEVVFSIQYLLAQPDYLNPFAAKRFDGDQTTLIDVDSVAVECLPECDPSLFDIQKEVNYTCNDDNVTVTATIICTNNNLVPCNITGELSAVIFSYNNAISVNTTDEQCSVADGTLRCAIDGLSQENFVNVSYTFPIVDNATLTVAKVFDNDDITIVRTSKFIALDCIPTCDGELFNITADVSHECNEYNVSVRVNVTCENTNVRPCTGDGRLIVYELDSLDALSVEFVGSDECALVADRVECVLNTTTDVVGALLTLTYPLETNRSRFAVERLFDSPLFMSSERFDENFTACPLPDVCPTEGKCAQLHGTCVRYDEECPLGSRRDYDLCSPTARSGLDSHDCACCIPCESFTCPSIYGADSCRAPLTEAHCDLERMRCVVDGVTTRVGCTVDNHCACLCRANEATRDECECKIPLLTYEPSPEPTPAPVADVCPDTGKCAQLGGFCALFSEPCPRGHRRDYELCSPGEQGELDDHDCACCIPCSAYVCPAEFNDECRAPADNATCTNMRCVVDGVVTRAGCNEPEDCQCLCRADPLTNEVRDDCACKIPLMTDEPSPEPTPEPYGYTDYSEGLVCPTEGKCAAIGGHCALFSDGCPRGHRHDYDLCSPAGSGYEPHDCLCCIPCSAYVCPAEFNSECRAPADNVTCTNMRCVVDGVVTRAGCNEVEDCQCLCRADPLTNEVRDDCACKIPLMTDEPSPEPTPEPAFEDVGACCCSECPLVGATCVDDVKLSECFEHCERLKCNDMHLFEAETCETLEEQLICTNATAEPTPAPPTPAPTPDVCPLGGKCAQLDGECVLYNETCPPGTKREYDLCSPDDAFASRVEEHDCVCCIPCSSYTCPDETPCTGALETIECRNMRCYVDGQRTATGCNVANDCTCLCRTLDCECKIPLMPTPAPPAAISCCSLVSNEYVCTDNVFECDGIELINGACAGGTCGACCAADGSCDETYQHACSSGKFTATKQCDAVTCPLPTMPPPPSPTAPTPLPSAGTFDCCYQDPEESGATLCASMDIGACTQLGGASVDSSVGCSTGCGACCDFSTCALNFGSSCSSTLDNGVSCQFAECPTPAPTSNPSVSCCHPDGSCTSVIPQNECDGVVGAVGQCLDETCGACCTDAECEVTFGILCAGVAFGDGSKCDEIECANPSSTALPAYLLEYAKTVCAGCGDASSCDSSSGECGEFACCDYEFVDES